MTKLPKIVVIALARLPFYATWVLFILQYDEGATVAGALQSGVITIGAAAMLGIAVWHFTGRYAWPARVRVRFYLTHLLAGSTYAIMWAGWGYAVAAYREGGNLVTMLVESNVLGWQFLTGLWLYGFVAGVSYSVRIRARLLEQERIAARAESLATSAQLQALRARLNPHFLFNALHSLSTLIRHDPQLAQRSVDQLGDLLRYVLDDTDDERVLLKDEWAFTRDYLALEQTRYGDRLKVTTDLDTEALACTVPPFVLQPLVENAVRHAVAPRPAGAAIHVRARRAVDNVEIVVEDNGPGVDPETIHTANGHGLHTLQQRLKALYGRAAGFTVNTEPDKGFAISLSLPVHQPPERDRGPGTREKAGRA